MNRSFCYCWLFFGGQEFSLWYWTVLNCSICKCHVSSSRHAVWVLWAVRCSYTQQWPAALIQLRTEFWRHTDKFFLSAQLWRKQGTRMLPSPPSPHRLLACTHQYQSMWTCLYLITDSLHWLLQPAERISVRKPNFYNNTGVNVFSKENTENGYHGNRNIFYH